MSGSHLYTFSYGRTNRYAPIGSRASLKSVAPNGSNRAEVTRRECQQSLIKWEGSLCLLGAPTTHSQV